MLRSERDYLLRMIAAAAAIAARLRGRLLGGTPPDEIVQQARAAQVELLGKDAPLLRALDASSVAQVVSDRQILVTWADLLRVEAEALRRSGQVDAAAALDARADALSAAG